MTYKANTRTSIGHTSLSSRFEKHEFNEYFNALFVYLVLDGLSVEVVVFPGTLLLRLLNRTETA